MLKKLFLPLIALAVVFTSCSKDDDKDTNDETPVVKTRLVSKVISYSEDGEDETPSVQSFTYDEKRRLVHVEDKYGSGRVEVASLVYGNSSISVVGKCVDAKYSEEFSYQFDVKLNSKGLINSISTTRANDEGVKYDLTATPSYNSDNTAKDVKTREGNGQDVVVLSTVWNDGNLIVLNEQSVDDEWYITKYKYSTYENKANLDLNTVFKSFRSYGNVFDLLGNTGMKSKNLVSECTSDDGDTETMTYSFDDKGYVIKAVRTYGDNWKKIYEVEYVD